MKIFDNTFSALERAMELRFKRHTVLTTNIANSETPNYRARELDFAGELQKAVGTPTEDLVKTNPLHMDVSGESGEHIVFDDSGAMGADGNNVDLDITTGKISDNTRMYTEQANYMVYTLGMLRRATRGSGGA